MAVEINGLGRARVRCGRVDCDALFVPRSPLIDARETRARAELYGWSCACADRAGGWQNGAPKSAEPDALDFCPEHTSDRARVPGG